MLKVLVIFSATLITLIHSSDGISAEIQQIGNVIIPEAFRNALHDGMSIPLYLHLDGVTGAKDDQRIGNASLVLDENELKISTIQLEEKEENATLNAQTRQQLISLDNIPFNHDFKIPLSNNAWLYLNLHQLTLQLVVRKEALGTLLHTSGEDIGQSSADTLSSTLTYNLGIYNNQMRSGGNNTSSYLSLNDVTALREHHVMVDGTFYGLGSGNHQSDLYKAIYERDFAGHRFAGGMLDSWNLQSLGPITAISAGKIYGLSWGNKANSTIFDNSFSVTPITAFLPAAGEVHIYRDGKLLSVQNFNMGSHEVDTRGLPYGIYDVDVEVFVNGRIVSKNMQRVNKIFSRDRAGAPLEWQAWGGRMHMDSWNPGNGKKQNAKETMLVGISTSGGTQLLSWAVSAYNYNALSVGETQISWPVADHLNLGTQAMVASDNSWSTINSLSTRLPGGFTSVWLSSEKTVIGDLLRRSDANNYAVGTTLNMNVLWSRLGSLSASYNNDHYYQNHYYTADYSQTIYSGRFGSLGLRAGFQRHKNGNNNGSSSGSSTEKYIAFDFSLPLGSWFRAGMTHQNGYTLANLAAQKEFNGGTIRTVGANLSRAISGDAGDDQTLSGGAWAKYDTRYSSGTLNVNSSIDGYINTNLTSSGSIGWQGKNIAASGMNDGNAGVIFRTDIDDEGRLTAKVNGRAFPLTGKRNYLPLEPYKRYEVEIENSRDSVDSYDVARGRKSHVTLYPGNVVLINPEIKERVTVFGRLHAEDGTLLSNARINNHLGRTHTDDHGEFVMDIDKKFPAIAFNAGNNENCEAVLDISNARGAVWVGDVICLGLKTFASTHAEVTSNES